MELLGNHVYLYIGYSFLETRILGTKCPHFGPGMTNISSVLLYIKPKKSFWREFAHFRVKNDLKKWKKWVFFNNSRNSSGFSARIRHRFLDRFSQYPVKNTKFVLLEHLFLGFKPSFLLNFIEIYRYIDMFTYH